MINNKLKLYVWEDVLSNFTDGMVCILATSLDDAKTVFLTKYPDAQCVLDDFFRKPHQIITKPDAFFIHGGA